MNSIKKDSTKDQVFQTVMNFLTQKNLRVESMDMERPWGGFYRINEEDTELFIRTFFNDIPASQVRVTGKLSPKVLIVAPQKRLSWQYHHRRSEIWRVISGTVKVVVSDDDSQPEPEIKKLNDIIILEKGQRHRLIGDNGWGIIAEIWQHTDERNSSDEEDIVRVEDDFGR